MSTRLDDMISGARQLDGAWDAERLERVRQGTLRRHGVVRRARALRRGLLVAGGAGLLVLGLLRAASSAPAEREASTTSTASTIIGPAPTAEALAARSMSDAGYARD